MEPLFRPSSWELDLSMQLCLEKGWAATGWRRVRRCKTSSTAVHKVLCPWCDCFDFDIAVWNPVVYPGEHQ